MILDEIHQKIREDPQELFEKVETNNNPSALPCKIQEDIQPQDQLPQKMERNFCPLQRKQKMPPPLTQEEIDQLINMQTASKTSYNQKFSDLSPVNPAYHKSENRFIHQEIGRAHV